MTTEGLENLIQDPDVFALGIDSGPIKEVLVEIAQRVDSLQMKVSKQTNPQNTFDNDEIRDINIRLNELSKSQSQLSSDFSTEVKEMKEFFNFQIRDLREYIDKSEKQINERISMIQIPAPVVQQTINSTPTKSTEPPVQYVPQTVIQQIASGDDGVQMKKLTYDVQTLKERIDSLISTINALKEERTSQPIHIEQIPDEFYSDANDNKPKLEGIKNEEPILSTANDLVLTPIKQTEEKQAPPPRQEISDVPQQATEDPNIQDLYAKLSSLSHEVMTNRDKISAITKTTNKVIIEVENQRQDVSKVQHTANAMTENIDKMHQRIAELNFETDKKTTNLRTILDDLTTKMDKQMEDVRMLQGLGKQEQTISLPDFDKLFNDMKGNVQAVINENDTNYRKQFNYLKNEMSNLKSALKTAQPKIAEIKESSPPPELATPPEIKSVEVPEPVEEPEPKTPKEPPTFSTAPPVTQVVEEEEPQPEIIESPVRSSVPTKKVYYNAEIQTETAEIGEIPVERVSFGTPVIMSMPNIIQTQFIVNRAPAPVTYRRPFTRSNSVKLVTVRTNTPKFHEGDTAPLKPNKGTAEVVQIDIPEPVETENVAVSPIPQPPSRHSASVTPRVKFEDSSTMPKEKEAAYIEYVDTEIQTDISVYASMGTTPIHSRIPSAIASDRKTEKPKPKEDPKWILEEQLPLPKIDSTSALPEAAKVEAGSQSTLDQKPSVVSQPPEMPDYSQMDHPDMTYMEQYDTHAEKYIEPKKSGSFLGFNRSNSIQYLVPRNDLVKNPNNNMTKSMSMERMLTVNIMGSTQNQAPIVINTNHEDGFSKEDQEELIARLTAASNPKRLDRFEQLLAQYHDEVAHLQSKMALMPQDADKKIMDIEQILNRWISNVQLIHRRMNEIGEAVDNAPKKKTMFVSMVEQKDGMISIPPSQKIEVPIDAKAETTTSAVMEPEIVIQMKKPTNTNPSEKKTNIKLSFANNEMLNQAPKIESKPRFNTTFEIDVRPEDSMIGKATISEQFAKFNERLEALKLVVTRFESDLYHIEHEVQEIKAAQPDSEMLKPIVEHHYHHARHSRNSSDSSKKDINLDSLPSSVKNSASELPTKDSDNKSVPEDIKEETNEEEEEEEKKKEDENKIDMGERPHSPEKPKTPPKLEPAEILTSDEKNMLIYKIQFAPAFFVEQNPPDTQKSRQESVASMVAALDTENITIPRYDEQIRIMRDALVDMRTNIQLLRQRNDDRFNQIQQKQMEISQKGGDAADSASVLALKKQVDTKFEDFEGQFKFLRQEMYEFMKDRPERIIEKVTEVVMKKDDDKSEKSSTKQHVKKEKKPKAPPPPPPPPPELDVDFSIKKTKKLIGAIESPRVFKVNHLETLSSPDTTSDESDVMVDENNNPVNVPNSRRSSFRPKQSSDNELGLSSEDETPASSDMPTQNDSKDQSSRSESITARKEEGHIVPQLIDEVSVYNALPKSDYTDKLVPMMMKMRDELKTYIDRVQSRERKLEKVVRDKCNKDYVESFFWKMRVIIQATHEKVKTVVDALPERVTKAEFEERLANLTPAIEKEAYAQQGNTAYSRCLFCGSKLPPGRVDLGNPEANGGKPIPPRSNIVNSEKGVVYKGRQSVGSIPTNAPLPPIGQKPKSPTSQSVNAEENENNNNNNATTSTAGFLPKM